MKIAIAHHNDLDGRAAAAVAYHYYKKIDPSNEIFFYELDYKDNVPISELSEAYILVVLDFSFKPEVWEEFRNGGPGSITWIDHHKTAIEMTPSWVVQSTSGVQQVGICAALLTWKHFFGNYPVPEVLNLIDAWDCWTHNDDPNVLDFISGVKVQDTGPESGLWFDLFDENKENHLGCLVSQIQGMGFIIRRYEAIEAVGYLKRFGHPIVISDHPSGWKIPCFAVNRGGINSKFFDSAPINDRTSLPYPIFVNYTYDGKKWTVSLYSTTVDVGEVAKLFGGGGHKGAAGFVCDKLPWERGD